MRAFGKGLLVFCVLGLVAVSVRAEEEGGAQPAGLTRVPGTVEIRGDPEGLGDVVVAPAFPHLEFEHPVWVGHPGDGTDRLFVAERRGMLWEFKNNAKVKRARKSLDISKRVMTDHIEEGVLGLAFHPDVRKNRRIFLSYIAKHLDGRKQVVSQFTMNPQRTFVRAKSEAVLIDMPKPWGNNNGGCIQFGPDGQLYISVGDGGGAGDPNDHAQDLGCWHGALLRVDPESGDQFKASKGNPFAGVRRAMPQIWAFGFRDLKRFSFDRVTGLCWGGDVGEGLWQEINVIEKGGNYGWNIRQGMHEFKEGQSLVALTDPLLEHGSEEARSITGGIVYRGSRIPGLSGAYIYGDEATGNVWMLRANGKVVTETKLVARGINVTCFGEDANGEVVLATRDGKIFTLMPGEGGVSEGEFPRRLSQTGLYSDTADLTPHPALIPYSINTPLWSDGAQKERLVMLPGNEKIHVRKDGTFEYPKGTIFVKHFYRGDTEEGARLGHRLETRLYMKRDRGWEGYTYVWNPEQNDAHLVDGRLAVDMYDSAESGNMITWTLPSRGDCASCHTKVANEILGFRVEALQTQHDYGTGPQDQLAALYDAGVFDKRPKGTAWPEWHSEEGASDESIRAYLDMNCAMCHQPNGPGNANIDLRWDTPLSKTNMVGTRPGIWHFGIQDARLLVPGDPEKSLLITRMLRTDIKGMPPTSHSIVDETAIQRVKEWVSKMKK